MNRQCHRPSMLINSKDGLKPYKGVEWSRVERVLRASLTQI